MHDSSERKLKKPNKTRTILVLCLVMVPLLLWAMGGSGYSSPLENPERPVSVEPETVMIEINAPSAGELTIAPGRHFKVSGSLSGEIPQDASLRVSLLDAWGHEVRYAETDQKGTDRILPSVVGGEITVFVKDTDFSGVAYTAPELAVADIEDPHASAHDATVKCVYTDTDFYALIVSATDPEHGLAEADGYELTDRDGRPYDALPEGKYLVRAVLSTVDGKELASASEEIEIGRTSGTIIHEMTTAAAIRKGGMELLSAWAADENLTILKDLLPGFFGTHYQMSTLPMSVSSETAEYLPGKIYMLLYGNTTTSTSHALEVARYLQLEHHVEDPDIAQYRLFDLGEPAFAGAQAEIIAFDEGENIHICRVDHIGDAAKDGVFLTTEAQVLGSDTDPSDGWTIGDGAFAVAGVMKPYQLRDDELIPDDDVYGFYRYLNGADALIYTFAPVDGSDSFSITKAVGVRRIDEPGAEAEPAHYEFYNVFPADALKAGNAYDVTVRAYDRKGAAIPGAVCEFTLSCHGDGT